MSDFFAIFWFLWVCGMSGFTLQTGTDTWDPPNGRASGK